MRVAITGATGFIGRRLVDRLLADRHEVVALTRDPTRARATLPRAARAVRWDPRAGTVDATALRDLDAVVHLAGESVAGGRWTAARRAAIRDSRVLGTEALMRALTEAPAGARPRALVAASAIGIYGDRGDVELDERAPPGDDFLAEVCSAWEAAARGAADLGVRVAIVRIGIVLGRDGGALGRMLPLFRLGLGGRLGSGRQWMSWILADDAVTGVLNGVAPRPVTNAEFTRTLAAALARPAILPAPAFALRLALGEMATLLLASQRVVANAARARGFRFEHAELTSALADLCHPLR